MLNTNAGKKAGEEFKKLYDKKHEEIAAAESELKILKDELDKQGPIMTEDARQEKAPMSSVLSAIYSELIN